MKSYMLFSKDRIRTAKPLSLLFSVVVVFIIGIFTSAPAQTPPVSPDRGAKLGNSFAIGDFETVNTTNGNLMLNFPLGSLSPGRGGIGSGINLVYNTKLYNMRSERLPDYRYFDAYFYKTIIDQDYKGGWSLVGGVRLEVEERPGQYQCEYGGQYNDEIIYSNKLRVVLPDGSTHEMIPYGHYDRLGDRYFNIDMNGIVRSCFGYPTYVTPPTYFSVDGSYLRLQGTSYGDWTLYLPDGGRVVQSPNQSSQRIYDRNGNYVNVSSTQVSDEFGRSVTVTADTNGDQLVTSKGFGGADLVWRIKWKMISVSKTYQSCPDTRSCPPEDFMTPLQAAFRVVDKIIQPQQLGGGEYVFTYNAPNSGTPTQPSDGWGEVSGIGLPTGAQISYQYAMDGQDGPMLYGDTKLILKNYPTTKTLTYQAEYDGVSTPVTETSGWSITNTESLVTSPDGSVTSTEFGSTEPVGSFLAWQSGLTLKTTQPDGTKKENLWERNLPVGCTNLPPPCPGSSAHADNPYVKTEFTSIKNSSGSFIYTAVKDYEYDKNGNFIKIREYDFMPYASIPRNSENRPTGLPANADSYLKRITKTDFYNETPNASSTNYNNPNSYHASTSPRLIRLVKSAEVQNGASAPQTRSEITYDYTDYAANNTKGGNATETKTWDSFKDGVSRAYSNPLTVTNSVSGTIQYDAYGNPTLMTDAKGNQTQITYGTIIGPNGAVSDLYPTQVISAYGTGIQQTVQTEYDFYTGLPKKVTALGNTTNENVVAETVYDALGRAIISKTAVNTPLEIWTQSEYNDAARRVIVRSDLFTRGDGKKIGVQHYDQLGRVRLSRTIENIGIEDPYNEQHGIKVQTRYQTGNPNSYQLVSNPYRAATATAATGEPSMGWTRSLSVNTGRHVETETFSGATLPAPWGNNTNSTGISIEDEDANATVTTDEAGKKRRTVEDALGRLIRVDEPDENNNLGSINSPLQPTNYSYDTLGNLTQIIQGGQTRTFTYGSLSRLLTANNPESGIFQHTYDANGNLLTKTDARGISTTYTYDALNRVTFRNYSDATPDISYFYDDTQVANSKGKLTKVSSLVSETSYTAFDAKDRLLGSRQITDGQTYSFGYTYNLNGDLLTQTYPSNKVVRYDYDNDGDLARVSGQTGQIEKTYANSFSYTAHGQVEKLRLGNGKWETTQFNSRLQATQIGLGHSATDTGLWKANYEYGEWESGAINQQKNNGNLARQTFIVPTIGTASGFTAVQTYSYDKLDRLKSATETVSGVEKWKQSFDYDRFGNKRFNTANTTLLSNESNVPKVANPEVLLTNNQYKADQDNDGINDYLYDPSGNITKDAQNRTFTYDGENRQMTAVGNNLSVSYAYDGNDKRVKSFNAVTNQTTIFVYDADGQLAAEYTINIPAPTSPTISYLTEDALGSVRVVTNSFGEVKARRDFLPFGEELYAGIGSRTTNQKYSANGDDTRKKFATYQRDAETGLDYAQSRYYSPMFGRFTSPDEFKGGPDELFDFEDDASNNPTFYADLTNPQSLNKYQYTYNNPYKFTDPTGHNPCCFVPVVTVWEQVLSRPVLETSTQIAKPTVETVKPFPPLNPPFPIIGSRIEAGIRPTTPGATQAGSQARPQTKTPSRNIAQPKVRPKTIRTQGNRDAQKVNQQRLETAKQNIERLKNQLKDLKSTQNKTPADKIKIKKVENQISKEQTRMKKSETHGKTEKGN